MSEIRTALWNSLLDAEMQVRYFGRLAQRYSRADSWLKIAIAFGTSTIIGSWHLWEQSLWSIKFSIIWQVVGGITALVALALPFLRYGELMRSATSLRTSWEVLQTEHELLWLQLESMDSKMAIRQYERIRRMEHKIPEPDAILPRKVRILRKCQNEVKAARGLS